MNRFATADQSVAESFLQLYAAHDWDRLSSLLSVEVTWTLPGRAVISGTAEGRGAVIDRVKMIIDSGVQTTLLGYRTGQYGVALDLRNQARSADGTELDEYLFTLLRIDGGAVVAIETYLSDVEMMERFFGLDDNAL